MRRIRLWLFAFIAAWVWLPNASAAEMPANTILLATTTSLDNSGLLGAILPIFTRETGLRCMCWRRARDRRSTRAARRRRSRPRA